MDPAYYVAAGSLKARSFQLESVSNNLANASTVGYKPERSFFTIFNQAKDQGQGLPLSAYVNDGTVFAQRGIDFTQGNNRPTGRSLDMALEGNGFFMVQTAQGARATRDGRFTLDAKGQLTASDGAPVLGKNGQPISVSSSAGLVTVLPDGTVQQAGNSIGQIAVKNYATPSALVRLGGNRYDVSGSAEAPATASITQGSLEQSAVDMPSCMIDMIRINRLFEMSMKVASTITNDLDARSISDISTGR